MTSYDFEALEFTEFNAIADLYRAAPEHIRETHAIVVQILGSAICFGSRGIEPAVVFRRAVGLGVRRLTSETELDDVVSHMNSSSVSYAVTVAPESQPPVLTSWLEKRGFTRGYAWMKFSRQCEEIPNVASDLETRVIGCEYGRHFGQVIVQGFELPPTLAPWIGALVGRPNWICVMAFEGEVPVAAGAVYVNGKYAWLGFGATLPAHRRRGAQSVLLARRLSEAKACGAETAVTETGERLPGKPSGSYRNILRSGFEEIYLRQNYLSPYA